MSVCDPYKPVVSCSKCPSDANVSKNCSGEGGSAETSTTSIRSFGVMIGGDNWMGRAMEILSQMETMNIDAAVISLAPPSNRMRDAGLRNWLLFVQ